MNRHHPLTAEQGPEPGAVLVKAALRAARFLGLSQAELAQVIGVSGASASRMAAGSKVLEVDSKTWQLAALFVRLFRSLDAIVGSDDEAARAWMRSANVALGGIPAELLRDPAGLVRAVDYLDAARARV